jgi:hypothetical protein
MHIFIQDTNPATSTQSEAWRTIQQSPINFFAILKNAGSNNIDYQFQESSDGQTWSNIASASGTLTPSGGSQVASYNITSSLAMVRLLVTSSAGSTIDFSVARYAVRTTGGPLPILAF